MKPYTTFSTRQTPQSEPIPGKDMVQNTAGGYAFQIDDWKRLERFLILGNEGGTYYASERKLTRENAECVMRCIKKNGPLTVERIVAISKSGRAPKNDPALFALAMCAGLGDEATRKTALYNLQHVARIGTHLFHFAAYVKQFRGWGRTLNNAVKKWYADKSAEDLAYQAVKYQSRDGWSHRDMLRLCHVKSELPVKNSVYKWIVKGEVDDHAAKTIEGFEKAKSLEKPNVSLITDYKLTREMIPTSWLNFPETWEALLQDMPITAMIRNLGKMSNVGLLKPMSKAADKVIETVTDMERLKKGRVHPISVLVAMKIYQQGHGERGKLSWEPVSQVVDALDNAFYMAFETIEPTNKRWLIGLDVSGSMGGATISGMPLMPSETAAAMCMVTAKSENKYHIMGFSDTFRDLAISPRQRLDDVIRKTSSLSFGNTDCSLPMLWAIKHNVDVDVFAIYTDNETWYGSIHPIQALQMYRQKTGINAKLIVMGMTATEFSIADPKDAGMLDVVGFDTTAPQVMADFARE